MKDLAKVILIVSLITVLVALSLFEACAQTAPTSIPSSKEVTPATAVKPIELKFNIFTPSTHAVYVYAFKPWCDEFEKRAGGRVKVVPFFSGALAKQDEGYDAAVKRVSDMSFSTQRSTPGRFSLSELMYLPGLGFPDATVASMALWDIYSKFPEVRAQYDDTHVVLLMGLPPRVIGTVKKPVRVLEDLKNMKIWVTSKVAVNMMQALGATPVTMETADVYESVQKGVLEGVGWSASSMTGNRVHELLKYVTNIPLDSGCFFFVINKDAYNSLPKDIQKIMDDMGGEWGFRFMGERYTQAEAAQWEVIKKANLEVIPMSPQEIAKWNKAVESVAGQEVAALEGKGLPVARKVYEELVQFANQNRK